MFNRRLIVVFLILAAIFAAIFVRLLTLQVFAHQDYIADAEQLMLRPPVLLPCVRGEIFDRKGKSLATNEPCFNIGIHYAAIRRSGNEEYINALARARARAHGIKLKRKDPTPPFYLQQVTSQIQDMWQSLPVLLDQPVKIINDQRDKTIRTIERWRTTRKRKLQKRLRRVQDNWLESASSQAIKNQISSLFLREENSFIPIAFGLDNHIARNIQTHLGCPEWLTLIPATRRVYPHGYVAAQIIGSIGLVSKDDLDDLEKGPAKAHLDDPRRTYAPQGDIIGRTGIERGYDWISLRGSRGLQQKDRLGNIVPGSDLPPEKGQDLHLTIDIDLQADLEQALAKGSPKSPAAAVVIDIPTGHILALASTPLLPRGNAKPPTFVVGDLPWMNRCVEAIYPPGSSVKPAVILAGLSLPVRDRRTGTLEPPPITSQTTHSCPTVGQSRFIKPSCKNHPHGSVDPRDAIKRSCNVYCATVAELLSWDLVVWFTNMGLARPTNLLLPRENPGTIPGGFQSTGGPLGKLPAFEARQIAIGQGKLAVTPLQVANMMATIARRGVYFPPRIADQQPTATPIDLDCDPANIDLVIEAMEAVVHESGGTAYRIRELRDTGLRIAAKTGTAQYSIAVDNDWRCWFAGFAPADNPQIAFAVLVENGKSGAAVAGPRAAELLQLCIDRGYIKTSSTDQLSLQSSSTP